MKACLHFFNGLTNTIETLNDVKYLDENGEEQTADNVAVIDNQTAEWSGGWYVVNSDVEISDRITVSGDVHLILADGNTLTAESGIGVAGESNSLTIYGQTGGTGKLITTALVDQQASAEMRKKIPAALLSTAAP